MSSPARILLTGAAGFIGMHQARTFLEAGYEVLGIDNLNAYYSPELKTARLKQLSDFPAFSFEKASVEDEAHLFRLFERFKPDYLVHLAAQAGVRYSLEAPRAYTQANVEGFLSILEACRRFGVKHCLYASSSSVYGANTKVPFCETDRVEHPLSFYAATKRANELMAQTYAHLYRIPLTGLRFFTVYGPWGRPDMAMWKFTDAILAGRAIDVFDEANMSRDFTYIDDITGAIARLLPLVPDDESAGAPHRILNIGNHTPVKLKDFIAAIEEACATAAIKNHLPRQSGDVVATYADVSRLAALTGFSPDTPIGEGTKRFVDWYQAYRATN